MSRFDECLSVVLKHEGGYSDHPADRGGATNYGVTTQRYDTYRQVRGIAPQPVLLISHHEVKDIYAEYWKAGNCAYMPVPLDLLVFDTAVNSGPGRAIKLLQNALGVDADGVCGPMTMTAVHEEMAADRVQQLCWDYLAARRAFLDRIVERDPTQLAFQDGWHNRLKSLSGALA